jgi:hypothetical protein
MGHQRTRYWLIWIDDTPVGVHQPLTAKELGDQFLLEAGADPTALIEVKMCTREDLDWAGGHYADGVGADELDQLDDDDPDDS